MKWDIIPGQSDAVVGIEKGHVGKWYGGRIAHDVHFAVGRCLIDGTVQHDHLAVQPIERADAEVPVLQDLAEMDVLLVDPLDEGIERRHGHRGRGRSAGGEATSI